MSSDELNVDTGSCVINNYISRLETDIVNANGEPAKVFLTEEITVNNQVGLLANREEQEAFKGPVPIDHYPINNDVIFNLIHILEFFFIAMKQCVKFSRYQLS
jgi:hypothetical protein